MKSVSLSFSSFTNLYSLSKTLRFELKPTEATKTLLKDKNVLEIDAEIARLYKDEMKPMLDDLHARFINDSLSQPIFDTKQLQEYFKLVSDYKNYILKKDKDRNNVDTFIEDLRVKSASLRKNLTTAFLSTGEVWKKHYSTKGIDIKETIKGHHVITELHTLDILLAENPEKEYVIKKFKGFWTYFRGFNQNRENYYSEEAIAASIANRTVNENLSRYIDNIIAFNQIGALIPSLQEYKDSLSIDSYNSYLNQEGIDQYNKLIGGYVDEHEKKNQGINEKINLYRQQNNVKLPKLKMLYKQIGSDKKGLEIFAIKDGKEWQSLQEMFDLQQKEFVINGEKIAMFEKLETIYNQLFNDLKNNQNIYDLNTIFLNKISINTISNSWFTNWQTFAQLLKIKEDKQSGEQKIPSQISLFEIKNCLENIKNENGTLESIFKSSDRKNLFESNAWITFLNIWHNEIDATFKDLEYLHKEFKKYSSEEFKRNNKDHLAYIKNSCDALIAIQRMARYFVPHDENLPRDEDLYWIVDLVVTERDILKYYNAFRNHLSKKPYNQDKIKLNFENGSLLGGWSDGQETNKSGVILRNKGKYYLGILRNRGIFRTDKTDNEMYRTNNTDWERLLLSNLKFQTLAGRGFMELHNQSYGAMDPSQSVPLLQSFIKERYIKKYPQLTDVANKKFDSKKEFDAAIKEALKACFTMKFTPIAEDTLKDAVDKGDMYLFEIYNKDFSSFKSGKENIHTIYWKELFDSKNCESPILALNGGAEVFYRKGQKEKLNRKHDKQGKEILDGKRYGEDKLFFHVPITINYGEPKNIKFRERLTDYLQKNNVNIIGIDRGEKHLLYYSVINPKGEILEQGSFNKIQVGEKEIDFHEILTKRASEMMHARQNWEQIGSIKNFKEGYLSQVIHEIYKLILKYNAIITLEDLNSEFKAKRTAKVEKSVYKKFELALAKKLNHLILKDKLPNEQGGVLNAYQLTPSIDAGKVGQFERAKQWGIMFYVRANYTSTTDPLTGWRKHHYISSSDPIEKIKTFFDPANENVGMNIFFSDKHKAWGFRYIQKETNKQWELLATKEIERYRYDRDKKSTSKINLYDEFNNLFEKIDKTTNIYSQLITLDGFRWKSLAYLWELLNQIRNTNRDAEGNENDFIQSPIFSEKINGFFDSRKISEYKYSLPKNGDANGAYNTAKKGLMLVKRIIESPEKYDLFIKDTEWDTFAAQ